MIAGFVGFKAESGNVFLRVADVSSVEPYEGAKLFYSQVVMSNGRVYLSTFGVSDLLVEMEDSLATK